MNFIFDEFFDENANEKFTSNMSLCGDITSFSGLKLCIKFNLYRYFQSIFVESEGFRIRP